MSMVEEINTLMENLTFSKTEQEEVICEGVK